MDYFIVLPDGQLEDRIVIKRKAYRIRFLAKHAEHIMDNYSDPMHNIKHREIQSLVRKSIWIESGKTNSFCVGRHKRKIYQTVVELNGNEILIKSCYLCNMPPHRELLKLHESTL